MECTYCDRPGIARKMCIGHYRRWQEGRDMTAPLQRLLITDDLEQRLRLYAPAGAPDECWLWTGGTAGGGYGSISVAGSKKRQAHIVAWELANDESAAGRIVRHTCDVRPCVNPAHLVIGTQADNVADMVNKGRQCFGERNAGAKLVADQVLEIRDLYATGAWTQNDLAKAFHVSRPLVSMIVSRKVWSHI